MDGKRRYKKNENGNHINMISLKEICLFMVILLSCSLNANGTNLKSSNDFVNNEVNDSQSELLNEKRKTRSANDNENYNDGYVMEDMKLVQHDEPLYSPKSHRYGQMQRDYAPPEPRKRAGNAQQNWQLTKEVLIKQGSLKGVIRPMHPDTGLRNVRQYLGIPYAAAPIGNGRFMPPGLYTHSFIFELNNSISKVQANIFQNTSNRMSCFSIESSKNLFSMPTANKLVNIFALGRKRKKQNNRITQLFLPSIGM